MHLAVTDLNDMQCRLYPVQLALQLHAVQRSAQELITERTIPGRMQNLI